MTREEEKEFLLKLKRISKEILHWEEKIFHTQTDTVSRFLETELEEQVTEIFGDTRGVKLYIDGDELMGDVCYDWDEPDADDPEKQEDFYYECLETNRKALKELSENIKTFIKIIEKELKGQLKTQINAKVDTLNGYTKVFYDDYQDIIEDYDLGVLIYEWMTNLKDDINEKMLEQISTDYSKLKELKKLLIELYELEREL